MIPRIALFVALLAGCTAPPATVLPSASASPTTTPTAARGSSPPTPSPSLAPSPGTRVFAGAGLETYAVGRLSGEVALVIRPVTPKPPDTSTSYRELWAVPLDGRPPVLAVMFRSPEVGSAIDTNSLERQLSPDGRRIVLSVGIGEIEVAAQLEVIDLETGRVTPLTPGSGLAFEDASPAWSPDGTLIAFTRSAHKGPIDLREIYVIGPDGQGLRRVRPATGRGGFTRLYGWLADSRHVAFDPLNFESAELHVIDLNGIEAGALREHLNTGQSAGQAATFRGRAPTIAAVSVDSPFTPSTYDLFVADAVGATTRIVASATVDPIGGVMGLASPRWDPGGSNRLLYRVVGVSSTTVVLDLDAGTSVRFGSRVKASAWSQDGGRIVTVEEHPSTAADTLYLWTRDGQLLRDAIGLPGEPLIYRLTDLAARAY